MESQLFSDHQQTKKEGCAMLRADRTLSFSRVLPRSGTWSFAFAYPQDLELLSPSRQSPTRVWMYRKMASSNAAFSSTRARLKPRRRRGVRYASFKQGSESLGTRKR